MKQQTKWRRSKVGRAYAKSPKRRFQEHRSHAKSRGIEFLFSFEEWWAAWERSGKWKKRGWRKGCYVMSRFADRGPYSRDNCYIAKVEHNSYAAACRNFLNRPHPDDLIARQLDSFMQEPQGGGDE